MPAHSLRVLRSRKGDGSGSTQGDRFRPVDFGARLEVVLTAVRPAPPRPARGTLVFRGPRGGELSRSDVSRDQHKDALQDAGLRTTLRLHDLRHTAASWLAAGLPLNYVSAGSRTPPSRPHSRSTGTSRRASCAAPPSASSG